MKQNNYQISKFSMYKCKWVANNPLMEKYHDNIWGVPVYDDRFFFECLTLESAQAGLSWLTILKKQQDYKIAFENFDVQIVSKYSEKKITQLMQNKNIIRNRLKIESTINNAKAVINIQNEFGSFSKYLWQFVDHKPIKNDDNDLTKTELSDTISLDLKKRGFKFIGSKIIYAFMQATGIVNAHEVNCFRRNEV